VVGQALEELRALSGEFRVLGSYPNGVVEGGAEKA